MLKVSRYFVLLASIIVSSSYITCSPVDEATALTTCMDMVKRYGGSAVLTSPHASLDTQRNVETIRGYIIQHIGVDKVKAVMDEINKLYQKLFTVSAEEITHNIADLRTLWEIEQQLAVDQVRLEQYELLYCILNYKKYKENNTLMSIFKQLLAQDLQRLTDLKARQDFIKAIWKTSSYTNAWNSFWSTKGIQAKFTELWHNHKPALIGTAIITTTAAVITTCIIYRKEIARWFCSAEHTDDETSEKAPAKN